MHDPAPTKSLQWLLENFIREVPGVTHALLASTDGIELISVNLPDDRSGQVAAVVAGLQSLGNGLARVLGNSGAGNGVKQVMAELDEFSFFMMRVGHGLPAGHEMVGTDSTTVATCLGIVAEPEADFGHIAFQAAQLSASLARYLTTPVRLSDTAASGR
jgi:predicted regulator of Ras-like GTPase activity (Roadblock/LC7/MglB family)